MKKYLALFMLSLVLQGSGSVSSTVANQPAEKSSAPARRTPYILDNCAFADALAMANDEEARQAVLAQRWEAVTRAVAYCNVAGHGPNFSRSPMYWQSGYIGGEKVEPKGNLDKPAELEGGGTVIVRGDCLADLTVEGHSMIHIYGDLAAKISTADKTQCEIIIGGDIRAGAKIDNGGIAMIFVGGNVNGDIQNEGASFITWINGDLNGTVETGTPITSVHVMGDFNGSMKPFEGGALATLDVRGFMSADKIKAVTGQKYTEFQASIAFSDVPAGLYPKPEAHGQPNVRWVVHVQRQARQVADNTRSAPAPKQAPRPNPAAGAQKTPVATKPTGTTQQAGEPKTRDAEAESMLRSAEKRYSTAKTYRDEGLVHTKFLTKSPHEDERPFSTAFERDGRFCWEFRSSAGPGERPTQRYVVWSRDQKTFDTWWDITRKHEQHDSIGMALAGPTGISGGSALAIIPMLCSMEPYKRTNLRNPTMKGTEKIQGVDCTIIEGEASYGGSVRLWLDSSFAIRQIFESREINSAKPPGHDGEPAAMRLDTFVAETTITIRPTFDAAIDDKEFDFEPPSHEQE